jgi:glycosyltransferase involved in cell wall biosynthesis
VVDHTPSGQAVVAGGRERFAVSLVIPLRNEVESVSTLLGSLAGQTRAPDEVVVVDAGSTDGTLAALRAFDAPFPLLLLTRGTLHPGEARNDGVAHAANEWIGFMDGGFELDQDWLAALLDEAAVSGCEVVFGSYDPVCDSRFRECAAIAYVPKREPWGGRGPAVPGMLIRRSTFDRLGGFPSFRASEDLLFLEAIQKSGVSIAYAPRATARWQLAGGWASTFRRFAEYSWHNLKAGRGRFWHVGVTRLYGAALLALALCLSAGLGVWSALVLPAFFLGRALKAAWAKRGSLPFDTLLPWRVGGAALVLAIIDAATLWGALRWAARAPSPFPQS